MQGRFHHRTILRAEILGMRPGRGASFSSPGKRKRQKTLPPELHRRTRNPQPLSYFLALDTVGSHQNNLGTLHIPHGKSPSPYPRAQDRPLFGR